MTAAPRFELVPIERLKIHEEIHDAAVRALAERIRREGRIERPLLVSSEGWVILDGHHRFAALRELGAIRVPAWIVDYHEETIDLDRWQEGPPISKKEVIERAVQGRPFSPKTTRHKVRIELPDRPTALDELLGNGSTVPAPARPRDAPP